MICKYCRNRFSVARDPESPCPADPTDGPCIFEPIPAPMSVEHAISILSIAVLEIRREQQEMQRHIEFFYFFLRELGHHPDTIHVTLTTKDKPLNPNDQAQVTVVESSSKTGATFAVNPANLQYSIDNGAVASVDGNGIVTAIAEGTATLTVKDTSNGLTGTAGVTVTSVAVPDAPDTLVVTLTPIVAGAAVAAAALKSGAKPVN
jgi:hypothetical protein